jgi:hypothetical protein
MVWIGLIFPCRSSKHYYFIAAANSLVLSNRISIILRHDPILCHGVFYPWSRSIVRIPLENPRVELALIFRPCLCAMAKRLRDVCGLPESEPLWRAGRGFVVRDLPECAHPRAQQRDRAQTR